MPCGVAIQQLCLCHGLGFFECVEVVFLFFLYFVTCIFSRFVELLVL